MYNRNHTNYLVKKKETNFFDKVYEITRLIPPGRVTSYGAIARCIGSPQSSRMVGWALNKCSSTSEYVPAHRVVNRTGLLTGKQHFDGSNLMKELLENEGIVIINNQIKDFDRAFWDPMKEME
ncbi:MAG: MGMT family protein [Bacteroidota bacterium]|nr:MGMT family protein [Bacteroidota bacterium]